MSTVSSKMIVRVMGVARILIYWVLPPIPFLFRSLLSLPCREEAPDTAGGSGKRCKLTERGAKTHCGCIYFIAHKMLKFVW